MYLERPNLLSGAILKAADFPKITSKPVMRIIIYLSTNYTSIHVKAFVYCCAQNPLQQPRICQLVNCVRCRQNVCHGHQALHMRGDKRDESKQAIRSRRYLA